MGRKQTGKGKYIHFSVTILICFLLSQCATQDRSTPAQKVSLQEESFKHLIRAQKLFAHADYEAALEENQKVLSLSTSSPPADEALYNTALIYSHPRNPGRDYVKSIATFKRLIKEYPQSTWTEQAKIWVHVIQESENAKQIAATVTQENDKLKRTAATLSQENDKLKRTAATLSQENDKLKRTAATLSQENDKLKSILEESRKVDMEIEEKKKEIAK